MDLNILLNKFKKPSESSQSDALLTELTNYRDELLKRKGKRAADDVCFMKEKKFRLQIRQLTGTEHGAYEYLPKEFQDTVYRKNRLFAEAYTNFTLAPYVWEYYHKYFLTDSYLFQNIPKLHMFVQCCGIIPLEHGVCLIIRDPYGTAVTEPISFITLENAQKMIDRMLALDVTLILQGGDKIKVTHIRIIKIPFSGDETILFPELNEQEE